MAYSLDMTSSSVSPVRRSLLGAGLVNASLTNGADDSHSTRKLTRLVKQVVNECVHEELAMVSKVISAAAERAVAPLQERIALVEGRVANQSLRGQLPMAFDPPPRHNLAREVNNFQGELDDWTRSMGVQMGELRAQLTQLQDQFQECIGSLVDAIEVGQLRNRLQGVANGMLALSTPDLTVSEKGVSMQALQQEEVSRLDGLTDGRSNGRTDDRPEGDDAGSLSSWCQPVAVERLPTSQKRRSYTELLRLMHVQDEDVEHAHLAASNCNSSAPRC